MNVIAVNGSPRKDWSTGTLLRSALEGADSMGAQTRVVHLYDLTYKGCTSCFRAREGQHVCRAVRHARRPEGSARGSA